MKFTSYCKLQISTHVLHISLRHIKTYMSTLQIMLYKTSFDDNLFLLKAIPSCVYACVCKWLGALPRDYIWRFQNNLQDLVVAFLYLPCGIQGPKSRNQVIRKAPLAIEPTYWPWMMVSNLSYFKQMISFFFIVSKDIYDI